MRESPDDGFPDTAGVTAAHTDTGKPVWITEVGWPTAVSQPATGDSLQWTELEQAQNIFNFVTWSAKTGYVAAVTIFGYRDYGTNDWYGVER
jgi:exo-beta-1,3-glucanase (GH17 family)